jgi:hypothetical protein
MRHWLGVCRKCKGSEIAAKQLLFLKSRAANAQNQSESLCNNNVYSTDIPGHQASIMTTAFVPRAVFPTLDSLPRSYFLGHHAAGLSKMKTMVSSIDLIIECRDYRVPLTSHNPLFEESLAGRERLVVYTKKDLGSTFNEVDRRVCKNSLILNAV